MDPYQALAPLLSSQGGRAYFGEVVSVATHMLQAGALAERSCAADAVVAAALLHDVGHILGPESTTSDAHHEDRGAAYLARWFGSNVCEPVRLHVAAKRYLCAVEADYYARLSDASRHSLKLQGGPMSAEEARAFETLTAWSAAVVVRRCDDAAKDPEAATVTLEYFRPLLLRLIDAHSATGADDAAAPDDPPSTSPSTPPGSRDRRDLPAREDNSHPTA
jgi:gamma-butyrobetaine dioxygenase